MAWRPHGRAVIDANNPNGVAVCDRCNLVYNLRDLVYQYDWRGNEITNIRLRVCTLTCLDVPYEGRRPIFLPPDPLPLIDPRPLQQSIQESSPAGNIAPASVYWDEPGILWDDGIDEWGT